MTSVLINIKVNQTYSFFTQEKLQKMHEILSAILKMSSVAKHNQNH